MNNSNSVVIHVIRAKELRLKKHKGLDVQVSLTTAGNSKWKSKVSTNSVWTTDGNCEFGEHCEFQLTDEDLELHISVNHKTMLGTTESMGQYVFVIERMSRYQPPTWFRLFKRGRDTNKEYGYIQLEYQFANKIPSSISNFSLNKMEKERKFDKLVNKMKLIAKKKDTTADDKSIMSVSLSRKSSFSSNTSALAFSLPSPNHMAMAMAANARQITEQENQITLPANFLRPSYAESLGGMAKGGVVSSLQNSYRSVPADRSSLKRDSLMRNDKGVSKELSDFAADSDNMNSLQSMDPPRNITSKVRHRAEQILNLRHRKQNSEPVDENGSRPSSIASSSGFASLGSNNHGALNENTSPEHLLSVIKHLRHEILAKENRIRDLEEYTDRLLSKIIVYNPELLQVGTGPPIAAGRR